MKILIPTYRRPNVQTTFANLPTEWRKETVMVVDEQDAQELKSQAAFAGVDFWVRPEGIKGIAQKRKWMLENILEDKVAMMDDDLSFEVRCTPEEAVGLESATRAATPEDIGIWLSGLDRKLDDYAHAGFSVRRHNDKLPAGWFENSRIQCVLGYRPAVMREHCELGRIELREDFDYTLQLLRKGFPNAICSEILFSQNYNAPGGVSTYRTLEYNNAQARVLENLHPGLVKAVQRKYKTQKGDTDGGLGERVEVICHWKKAYKEGEAMYGRREING